MIEMLFVFQLAYIISFLILAVAGYFLFPKMIKALFENDKKNNGG
tara:strand:+ start:322 stop:456 length:135 start_codon:yes stop_codon:yes gene_type:complete